ncbi:2864_t:CDS:2, partial [Cetraspora pellucida]
MTTQFQNKDNSILFYQPQINNMFKEYNEFVNKIKNYACKLEYNSEDKKTKKEQNRASQCCGCSFYIYVSLNITGIDLTHNYQM